MLSPCPAKYWNRYTAAHLLNRAGFGGTPAEIDTLESLGQKRGISSAVESFLNADDNGDLFEVPPLLTPGDRFAFQQRLKVAASDAEKQAIRKEVNDAERTSMIDLRLWWLNRMRYTSAPLLEKATLFWHGHFATSNQKVNEPYMMWQQNETLRHYALGRFPDLLKAMSRDPAMIRWLDLESSRKNHPNENFAREVMELFSLGEGHYSEKDVQEGARAFTGYRVNQQTGYFQMSPNDFDPGQKSFLGQIGALTGDEVIDIIVAQPQCARFIGRKLWVFFVSDNPSDQIVDEVATLLFRNGYDIGATLGVIFQSAAFYSPNVIHEQIKSPVQWMIQTTKMLEIPLPDPQLLENSLYMLGQLLFSPPNVKGWDGGRSWISASSLLYRYNLAAYLLSGRAHVLGGGNKSTPIPLDKIVPLSERGGEVQLVDPLGFRVFNAPLSPKNRSEFFDDLLRHPVPYTDMVVRDLLQIMMGTPEFQLC